jgi:hypothetical protein
MVAYRIAAVSMKLIDASRNFPKLRVTAPTTINYLK